MFIDYDRNMTLSVKDLTSIKGIVQTETRKIVQVETKKIIQTETRKIVQTDTQKIVQDATRKIINGQSAMKSELLTKISGLDKKIDGVEERLTKRIDKIGLTVAQLQEDAPTIEEFDELENRVTKLEHKIVPV
jgi:hypothetical protein